jgi:protein TonB
MFAIRVPFSVVAGTLSSVAIFLGLAQLVSASFDVAPSAEARIIEFTRQIVETPLENRRDPKVTREPPILRPGPVRISGSEQSGTDLVDYGGPSISPVIERKGLVLRGIDGDAIPLVRPNPDYPASAISREIEGWVQVQFSVTAAGTVRDAVVVESEPGTTFDEAALEAIARWRYNPRVVDGVAVERVGLETVIRFELDEQNR